MFLFLGSLILIVLVAATNLYLGYTAAVYLGRGAKRWTESDYATATLGVVVRDAIAESNPLAGDSEEQEPAWTSERRSFRQLAKHWDAFIQGWKTNTAHLYADDQNSFNVGAVRSQFEDLWKAASETNQDGENVLQTLPESAATYGIPEGIENVEKCFASLTADDANDNDETQNREKCLNATNAVYELRDRIHNAYHMEFECDAPFPGLWGVATLNGAVQRWQSEGESKTAVLGLIDIDLMQGLNEEHGPHAGDGVLDLVCDALRDLPGDDLVLARISGQRFRLFSETLTSNSLAEFIEHVRQKLEKTTFQIANGDFQTTLSAAVADAQRNEAFTVAEQQLEISIQEAKSYGRNRTFIMEKGYPTPIVPPDLSVVEQTVALNSSALAIA